MLFTVTLEDKRRVQKFMDEQFESLLDEGHFVQRRKAESREEGREEGHEEGLAEGLQEALITTVEIRFPSLVDMGHEKIRQIKKPDTLRLLLKGMKTAPNEEAARLILDLFAA